MLTKILTEQYGYTKNELDWCNGIMGVPVTYLAYHCDEQFEILGKFDGGSVVNELDLAKPTIDGKSKYKRIAIKRKFKFGGDNHED